MRRISRRYLRPAGHEFAKVVADFERLMNGAELFKTDGLKAITDAPDNNVRADALETFVENVLPLYDDLGTEFPDILRRLGEAVERARATAEKPIETPYGVLRARIATDITRWTTTVVERYHRLDPGSAFELMLGLYPGVGTDDERELLAVAAEKIAKHSLRVWKDAGPAVQVMIVERLSRLDEGECRGAFGLIVRTLKACLGTNTEGLTGTSGTVTIHHGSVGPSPALTDMRTKASVLLEHLYLLATNDDDRWSVQVALDHGTEPPRMRS